LKKKIGNRGFTGPNIIRIFAKNTKSMTAGTKIRHHTFLVLEHSHPSRKQDQRPHLSRS
jgi:hypothetical protein